MFMGVWQLQATSAANAMVRSFVVFIVIFFLLLFLEGERNYRGVRAPAARLGLECATHRNFSKSIQNQTESLRTPKGILVFWVALRARN